MAYAPCWLLWGLTYSNLYYRIARWTNKFPFHYFVSRQYQLVFAVSTFKLILSNYNCVCPQVPDSLVVWCVLNCYECNDAKKEEVQDVNEVSLKCLPK